jgi:allantoicase
MGQNMPPESAVWTTIVAKKPLGPHRQHFFDVERSVPIDQVFSHVRLSTYPGESWVSGVSGVSTACPRDQWLSHA